MSIYRPLQKCDARVIRRTLPTHAKIYSAARVSFRLSSVDHSSSGSLALARLKGNGAICIFLVLPQGGILWSQPLSKKSKLQECPENPLSYKFYDEDTHVNADVVFEDPSEADKLKDKFPRLLERIEFYNATTTEQSDNHEGPSSDVPTFVNATRQTTIEPIIQIHLASNPSAPCTKPSLSRALVQVPRRTRTEEWVRETLAHDVARHASGTASQALIEADEWKNVTVDPGANEFLESWKSESESGIRSGTENTSQGGKSPSIPTKKTRTRTIRVDDKLYQISDVTRELIHLSKEKIEKGGFGAVQPGRLRDGTKVAIKRYKLNERRNFEKPINMVDSKRFRSEAFMSTLCGQLRHPNIIQFLGVAVRDEIGACLVLPWMENGDSLSYVRNNPEVRRVPIITGTITGLTYMHEKGILHGDVKSLNILIASNGTPIIGDFGLSCPKDIVAIHEMSRTVERAGNPRWMAPEILGLSDSARRITTKTDVWATGMFMLEILSGNIPYPGKTRAEVYKSVEEHSLPPRPIALPLSPPLTPPSPSTSKLERAENEEDGAGLHPDCDAQEPMSDVRLFPTRWECTDVIWTWVERCWERDPACRPEMRVLLAGVEKVMHQLETHTDEIATVSIIEKDIHVDRKGKGKEKMLGKNNNEESGGNDLSRAMVAAREANPWPVAAPDKHLPRPRRCSTCDAG